MGFGCPAAAVQQLNGFLVLDHDQSGLGAQRADFREDGVGPDGSAAVMGVKRVSGRGCRPCHDLGNGAGDLRRQGRSRRWFGKRMGCESVGHPSSLQTGITGELRRWIFNDRSGR
jgi:hypothetical protein